MTLNHRLLVDCRIYHTTMRPKSVIVEHYLIYSFKHCRLMRMIISDLDDVLKYVYRSYVRIRARYLQN